MSTVPIRCPYCDAWMRVAAQASKIKATSTSGDQLKVEFHDQLVAHICKKENHE